MGTSQKKTAGFGIIEVTLVVALIILLGFIGWLAYKNNFMQVAERAKTSLTKPTKATVKPRDPYTGWKTYNSSVEKATFKYPSNWTIDTADQYASNDPTNNDYTAVKSPDSKVVVHWTSLIDGFGNEFGISYPLNTVVDKTAIPGASGDYVVSGITTLDGSAYYPWVAVANDPAIGIISSGVGGSLGTFRGHNNINSTTGKPDGALFSTSGPRVNQDAPNLSQTGAKAYLSTPDMQQAKLILSSFSY